MPSHYLSFFNPANFIAIYLKNIYPPYYFFYLFFWVFHTNFYVVSLFFNIYYLFFSPLSWSISINFYITNFLFTFVLFFISYWSCFLTSILSFISWRNLKHDYYKMFFSFLFYFHLLGYEVSNLLKKIFVLFSWCKIFTYALKNVC